MKSAIEYYEEREDSRFRDYQNRMDKMLTDPEILKKMNSLKKEGESVSRHTVYGSDIQRAKTQMKMKLEYNSKLFESSVEKQVGGLKDKFHNKNKKSVTLLINEEMEKQNETWKLKLNQKKSLRSKSNITSPLREKEIKRIKTLTPMIREEERFGVDFKEDDELNIGNFVENENKKEKKEEKEEKEEEGKIETDEDFAKVLDEKLKMLDGLINLDEVKSEGANHSEGKLNEIALKYQNTCEAVENKLNKYVNDFNEFFYKEIFQNFFLQLKKLIDEKYEKYIEISVNYHSQIKENEFLLDSSESDEHQEAIKQSIELLKEDQEHQIGIIEFQYNSLINQKISDFKLASFKSNPGLQLIEEQLKLDIYQIINQAL